MIKIEQQDNENPAQTSPDAQRTPIRQNWKLSERSSSISSTSTTFSQSSQGSTSSEAIAGENRTLPRSGKSSQLSSLSSGVLNFDLQEPKSGVKQIRNHFEKILSAQSSVNSKSGFCTSSIESLKENKLLAKLASEKQTLTEQKPGVHYKDMSIKATTQSSAECQKKSNTELPVHNSFQIQENTGAPQKPPRTFNIQTIDCSMPTQSMKQETNISLPETASQKSTNISQISFPVETSSGSILCNSDRDQGKKYSEEELSIQEKELDSEKPTHDDPWTNTDQIIKSLKNKLSTQSSKNSISDSYILFIRLLEEHCLNFSKSQKSTNISQISSLKKTASAETVYAPSWDIDQAERHLKEALEYGNNIISKFTCNIQKSQDGFSNADKKENDKTNKIGLIINHKPLFTTLLIGFIVANIAFPLGQYITGGIDNIKIFYTTNIALAMIAGLSVLALSVMCLGVHYYNKINCTNLNYTSEDLNPQKVNQYILDKIEEKVNHIKEDKPCKLDQVVVSAHQSTIYNLG